MQRVERIGCLERCYSAETAADVAMEEALRIFENYQAENVICNSRFDDTRWVISDERKRVRFTFILQDSYEAAGGKWLACDDSSFVDSVRFFLLFHMGTYELNYLKRMTDLCMQLGSVPLDKLSIPPEMSSTVAEFLAFLPGSSLQKDHFLELLESPPASYTASNSRILASFPTYVQFEDRLSAHWNSASETEKIRLFPVYLWWSLTCILPLRPTEFLLTPAECLQETNGHFELSVRRTRLKKGLRQVHYHIDKDYDLFTYRIPRHLAETIQWYRDRTRDMRPSVLGTLFIPGKTMDYLNYPAMSRLLQNTLKDFEMEAKAIHLGDTRHLSMISLALTGDTPSICKALANHESIETSAGYYANMSTLADCRVLHFLHDSISSVSLTIPGGKDTQVNKDMLRLDKGVCSFYTVHSFAEGDLSECMKIWHPSSGPGSCIACPHFIPYDLSDLLDMKQDVSSMLELNWKWLMESIELLRRGLGKTETIDLALKRLQSNARLAMNLNGKEGLYGSNAEIH